MKTFKAAWYDFISNFLNAFKRCFLLIMCIIKEIAVVFLVNKAIYFNEK